MSEETAQQRLARDLAEILRFTRRCPDVGFMANLLLGLIREGRYNEPRPAVPGPYSGT